MDRDGAQNAKAEVFADVFGFQAVPRARRPGEEGPLFAPVPGTAPYRDIVGGRKRKRRDPRDLIALGILSGGGHNRDPSALRLGIFVQRADLQTHSLVERAQALARGEARVIYTGKAVRRAAGLDPCRPLVPGISVGHYRVSAGTLGCFCRHPEGGVGILSNNHILADSNKAARGDAILQPARLDGGRRSDPACRVATLYDYVPIDFEPGARNLVDCAFATLLGDTAYDPGGCPDGSAAALPFTQPVVAAEVAAPVRKFGRTSVSTAGIVLADDIDNLNVAMVLGNGERLARFDRQIAIESDEGPFSQGGDSGAVICTPEGPAALLFAGTDTGGRFRRGVTYANPLSAVLEALNLTLHTGA